MLTREEAINIFRELDEAGFAPALSVLGKSDYRVSLHIDGMKPKQLKKASDIMDRGEPDEGSLVRVQGEFLTAC